MNAAKEIREKIMDDLFVLAILVMILSFIDILIINKFKQIDKKFDEIKQKLEENK